MDENLIARTVRRVLSETGSTAHMSLKLAEALAAKVEERAESLGMRVVTAIADEAGHPKLVRSMDGAYIGSLDVCVNPAIAAKPLQLTAETGGVLTREDSRHYGSPHTNGRGNVIFGG